MTSERDKTRSQLACVVRVSPEIVDAGAQMTLHGEVSCAPACDLRGHRITIKDQAGAEAGTLELTDFDGKTNTTGELVVKAPIQAGRYIWPAVCPPVVMQGTSYAEAFAFISFSVKPHTTSVVVWDVPSVLVISEGFRIKVGIKCSSECHLTDREFGIYDHEGTRIATGALSGERWPGTSLYFAELELEAPAAEGLYTWSVKYPGSVARMPHDAASTSFGVRVVSHPEYVVVVETVDKVSQTMLSGARVVMHPYRTVTDQRGVAELRVAKGAYKLFVSETGYLTFGLSVEVSADMTVRAELELEPLPERN